MFPVWKRCKNSTSIRAMLFYGAKAKGFAFAKVKMSNDVKVMT